MKNVEPIKFVAEDFLGSLGKKGSVSAFERKADNLIGEELIHRLSGRRFFKATELHNGNIHVGSCPVEITAEGYRGITNEQFEALKEMRIRLKREPHGNCSVYDDFSATSYYGRKRKDGTTLAMSESMVGPAGRNDVPNETWSKIVSWFGDIAS